MAGSGSEAAAAFDNGNYEKAKARYKELLQRGQKLDAQKHIDILISVAKCCYWLKDYGEAEKWYRNALGHLDADADDFDSSHTKAIDVRHELARAISASQANDSRGPPDRLDKAIKLHRENIRLLEDHGLEMQTLRSTYSLASVILQRAKHWQSTSQKKRTLQEAAQLSKNLLDFPNLALSTRDKRLHIDAKYNYASILYHLDNHELAKVLFQEVEQEYTCLNNGINDNSILKALGKTSLFIQACTEADSNTQSSVEPAPGSDAGDPVVHTMDNSNHAHEYPSITGGDNQHNGATYQHIKKQIINVFLQRRADQKLNRDGQKSAKRQRDEDDSQVESRVCRGSNGQIHVTDTDSIEMAEARPGKKRKISP